LTLKDPRAIALQAPAKRLQRSGLWSQRHD